MSKEDPIVKELETIKTVYNELKKFDPEQQLAMLHWIKSKLAWDAKQKIKKLESDINEHKPV